MATKKFNLEPLERLLTKDIEPAELAEILDCLAYDYMRVSIFAQYSKEKGVFDKSYMNENADEFIYYLKTLRDTLWESVKTSD